MKKRLMTLGILLGVAGVLVAAIFIAKAITEKQSNETITEEKTYCFQVDQELITKIQWSYSDHEELTLVKNEEGEWHLEDEPEQALNETKVKTILNSIQEIPVYLDIEGADIEEYELDNPTNVVRVTCDGTEHTFTFGQMNPLQTYYYMLYNDHVYLVDLYENSAFDKERDEFYAEEEETEEETESDTESDDASESADADTSESADADTSESAEEDSEEESDDASESEDAESTASDDASEASTETASES